MGQNINLDHPTIGSLRGIQQSSEIEQYLGIQYATLADRFSRGTLVESYASPVDATTQGCVLISYMRAQQREANQTDRPLPVADPANCDNEQLLIQHTLPHPEYTFSDTECLTLNITAPSEHVRAKAGNNLPVLVFIHGGGFVTGSANWPQWDLTRLVEMSVKEAKPIVAVGIK
jgi:carboxylesterase type B